MKSLKDPELAITLEGKSTIIAYNRRQLRKLNRNLFTRDPSGQNPYIASIDLWGWPLILGGSTANLLGGKWLRDYMNQPVKPEDNQTTNNSPFGGKKVH